MAQATPTLERTAFRTSRLLDFASEKELTAQIGHPKAVWPVVLLKELVDNSLDACEEAGIAPVIEVTLGEDQIVVQDNGPGIPPDVVEDVLDFAVRISSREAYVSPTRGAQGNALKVVVAIRFVLDGHAGRVVIEAKGLRHLIDFGVDRIRQQPTIAHATEPCEIEIGTRVTVPWADSARSILAGATLHFLQVASAYPWLNPHLDLTIRYPNQPGEPWHCPASDGAWSKWRPSDPTSPHWYDPARFERLVSAYIAHDVDRGRVRPVRELVAEFRGLTGTAKQRAILDALDLSRAPLTALANGQDLDHDTVASLLRAMRAHSKPVKPKLLGCIGRDHLAARCAAYGAEMASFDYKRVADVTNDVPWLLETAFAWCPKLDRRLLITGVNWSPGIINPFRELGAFGRSLDTILSQQRVSADDPVVLVLHVSCPRVEYTDRGKSAVVTS